MNTLQQLDIITVIMCLAGFVILCVGVFFGTPWLGACLLEWLKNLHKHRFALVRDRLITVSVDNPRTDSIVIPAEYKLWRCPCGSERAEIREMQQVRCDSQGWRRIDTPGEPYEVHPDMVVFQDDPPKPKPVKWVKLRRFRDWWVSTPSQWQLRLCTEGRHEFEHKDVHPGGCWAITEYHDVCRHCGKRVVKGSRINYD